MKGKLTLFSALLTLTACQSASTAIPSKYTELAVTEGLLATAQYQSLDRIETRYPIEGARDGKDGCATLEYVITPDYQISEVQIVDASARYFAREAVQALQKWQWQSVPAGLITTPVKTQTRFEFCLENKEGRCALEQIAKRTSCRGVDALPVVGYRVMRPN
ncbi:biopolymer transporter TonB [Alishewanella longhuensis]|uniref:Biopolymer transporter TonB n=1 Tax=Alishewanella longhuensis TaxID=1091037 RepID=A0ABQ3KZD1_9ALTE|nr:energy transducer TonB [Alishewanella longhuensis]GHG71294.1 biopolymer transporter TonB [Alishewanella longhuensis]